MGAGRSDLNYLLATYSIPAGYWRFVLVIAINPWRIAETGSDNDAHNRRHNRSRKAFGNCAEIGIRRSMPYQDLNRGLADTSRTEPEMRR